MKNILFVNQAQFGYHIDYLQYSKHLAKEYDITYICWDYKKQIISISGIKVLYVSRNGNILLRNIRYIYNVLKICNNNSFKIVFIHYFKGASLLSIFNFTNKLLHLDIRTGNVQRNNFKRKFLNYVLSLESLFFRSKSTISEGLRIKLGLNKKTIIIPLGANRINVSRKKTKKIGLLYVGILNDRKLDDTFIGINLFLKKYPEINIEYTIVGDGWGNIKAKFQTKINDLNLENTIKLAGYIPHNQLLPYYKNSIIGISYIPITPYFEFQPATKTFEYLLSGMPVLATSTYENKKVINKCNGVLTDDNPKAFMEGLTKIIRNLDHFQDELIRDSVKEYEWEKIAQQLKQKILP